MNTTTNIINNALNLQIFLICATTDVFFIDIGRDPDIEYSLLPTSKPKAYLLMPQRNSSPATNINVIGEFNFPVRINCSSSKKHIVQNITIKCDKMTWTNGNLMGIIGLFRATILEISARKKKLIFFLCVSKTVNKMFNYFCFIFHIPNLWIKHSTRL